jgi:hypothetical protein
LIVAKAKLTVGVARLRVAGRNSLQIRDRQIYLSRVAFYEGTIVKSPRIVRSKFQCLLKIRASIIILLPLDLYDRNVGKGVRVVWPKLGDALKCIHRGRILLRVEQSNPVVIPSHPLSILSGSGSGRIFITGATSSLLWQEGLKDLHL